MMRNTKQIQKQNSVKPNTRTPGKCIIVYYFDFSRPAGLPVILAVNTTIRDHGKQCGRQAEEPLGARQIEHARRPLSQPPSPEANAQTSLHRAMCGLEAGTTRMKKQVLALLLCCLPYSLVVSCNMLISVAELSQASSSKAWRIMRRGKLRGALPSRRLLTY